MTTLLRRSLRAAIVGTVVSASCFVTPPIYATASPPIYDPLRPYREVIPPPPNPVDVLVDRVEDAVPADADGDCGFQGATIEGFAVSSGVPEQTGIVCRVYDQHNVLRGGCSVFVPGASASCAAPTEVVLGPPRVCTEAFAVYSWGTVREEHCS